jgi:hypothetical protein
MNWSAVIGGLGGTTLFLAMVPFLTPGLRRFRRARLAASPNPRFDCGLRLIQGTVPGLTKRWRHAPAYFDRPGVLVRGRKKTEVHLRSIDGESKRKPRPQEVLSVSRSAVIVEATEISGAHVEIAVLPDRLDLLLAGIPEHPIPT